MNEEKLKDLAKEEFMKNINTFFNSTTIFIYIQNLENSNKELQQKLKDLSDQIIDTIADYIKTEIPDEEFISSEWYVNILDKLHEMKTGKGIIK